MLEHPTTSGDMQRSSDIPKEEPLTQAVTCPTHLFGPLFTTP